MKKLVQRLSNGKITMEDVPIPKILPGHVLIRTSKTLISGGTERMLLEFGESTWISRIKKNPDKVKMVVDKLKTDGILSTYQSVKNKLDEPISLGYCNVGVVIGVDGYSNNLKVGDRVVSNGSHAEVNLVPANLCSKIPDNVTDENAAYVVVGAIALQGIRLANTTLGEVVVVIGLGLVGLLTVQLLIAHGCRVIGFDFDKNKLQLARELGAFSIDLNDDQDFAEVISEMTSGIGADAVIIAAATTSNDPIDLAAKISRKRGRIILTGVSGINISRDQFYKKELIFQVSSSYGPGRYDEDYVIGKREYPLEHIRWTAQGNFLTILQLIEDQKISPSKLTTNEFNFKDFEKAFHLLKTEKSSIGVIFNYEDNTKLSKTIAYPENKALSGSLKVAFIGAGGYANKVLAPAFKKNKVSMELVVSNGGVGATHLAKKFGFKYASSDADEIWKNSKINLVVIASRHDSHAKYVLEAIESGRHVFCEKPICTSLQDLEEIKYKFQKSKSNQIVIGFNRRFSPLSVKAKQLLESQIGKKIITITVNAGALPTDHWAINKKIGGGRIVGEACHFIDLMRFFIGFPIESFESTSCEDGTLINLKFKDGSIGSLHYLTNGSSSFPKERIEIYSNGKILQINNFRNLIGFGWKNFKFMRLWKQNKGNSECVEAFLNAIKFGTETPISFDEIYEVSRVSILLQNKNA